MRAIGVLIIFLRGALKFFADCLPDEFGDGSKPFLLVVVDVLLNAFDQGDRQRHLPVAAFLQDHDDPLPFYHGYGKFVYKLLVVFLSYSAFIR